MKVDWYVILIAVLIFPSLTFSVFNRARLLVINGAETDTILYIVGSLSAFIVALGVPLTDFYLNLTYESVLKQPPKVLAHLPSNWGSDLPANKRTEASLSVARIVFTSGGEITQFVNERGEWQQFIPSWNDLHNRDLQVAIVAAAHERKYLDLVVSGVLILFPAFAAFFGWYCGRTQNEMRDNLEFSRGI